MLCSVPVSFIWVWQACGQQMQEAGTRKVGTLDSVLKQEVKPKGGPVYVKVCVVMCLYDPGGVRC